MPKEYQRNADQRIRTAYAMKGYDQAKSQLLKTVEWFEGINPSAASSLREGLEAEGDQDGSPKGCHIDLVCLIDCVRAFRART